MNTNTLDFLRDETALGNLKLLMADVARDFDHLHAVEQGRGDASVIVRSANE